MHSHDRTLLAQLGFADPDKKEPEHDWACRYVTQRDVSFRLLDFVGGYTKPNGEIRISFHRYEDWSEDNRWSIADNERGQERLVTPDAATPIACNNIELPVVKGEAQYATTIGFVDAKIKRTYGISGSGRVVFRYRASIWSNGKDVYKTAFVPKDYRCSPENDRVGADILYVEVKIKPVPAGDVIRQIKTYQQYLPLCDDDHQKGAKWILAARYPMTEGYVQSLRSEGIHVIRLGDGFTKYLEEQTTKTTDVAEI